MKHGWVFLMRVTKIIKLIEKLIDISSNHRERLPHMHDQLLPYTKSWYSGTACTSRLKQDDERRQRLIRGSSPCDSVDPRATGTRTEAEVTSTHSCVKLHFAYPSSYRRDSAPTPSKCGTTWLLHIAQQLRMNGAEPDFEDQYECSVLTQTQ